MDFCYYFLCKTLIFLCKSNKKCNQFEGGVWMSFEAIDNITAAEENAKKIVADAEAAAKQLIAEAETGGKASVQSAIKKAEQELIELKQKTEAKAAADVADIKSANENKKAVLKAKAEGRMEQAAALVVERIVNG